MREMCQNGVNKELTTDNSDAERLTPVNSILTHLPLIIPSKLLPLPPKTNMTSKEYLEKVTIGKPAELSGKIILHEYDPNWEKTFMQEKERIEKALQGKNIIVEHVGSTSVPGLCAKPIIDILLLVDDSADEAGYVKPLQDCGYTLRIREPEWYAHRMLKREKPEVNLHVFSTGCEEAERMTAFRDRLKTNEKDRLMYADTKKRLAAQDWKYVQEYADAKSEVIQKIFKNISKLTD